MKLNAKQTRALEWLHHDGSGTRWSGIECGHPAMSTLMFLVRKGYATKQGSAGWAIKFYRVLGVSVAR